MASIRRVYRHSKASVLLWLLGGTLLLFPSAVPVRAGSAGVLTDLDQDASQWVKVYCETTPSGQTAPVMVDCAPADTIDPTMPSYATPAPLSVVTPSRDNQALRLAILGGPQYSNVLFRRKLLTNQLDVVAGSAFAVDLYFFLPDTTLNNRGGESRVQAIEFVFSDWRRDTDGKFRVYDWELQYLNVRSDPAASPTWNLWTGHSDETHANAGCAGHDWAPTGIDATIAPNDWHHVVLRGSIGSGYVQNYDSFAIDDSGVHSLAGKTGVPDCTHDQPEQVANVLVQLDGPQDGNALGGYDVRLDAVGVSYTQSGSPSPIPPIPPYPCPTSPEQAATAFGGLPAYWTLLPGTTNGWKYNNAALPQTTVPAIRNGPIPAGTQVDWTDGAATYRAVGPGSVALATIETMWCSAVVAPLPVPRPAGPTASDGTPTPLPAPRQAGGQSSGAETPAVIPIHR